MPGRRLRNPFKAVRSPGQPNERKIEIYGDGLIISQGVRVRPVEEFYAVVDAAEVKKAAIQKARAQKANS